MVLDVNPFSFPDDDDVEEEEEDLRFLDEEDEIFVI